MKTRIILGRYIERDSWVHRLDPRAKMVSMLLFMTAVFLIDSYWQAGAVLLFALVMMLSSRISLLYYMRAVKPLLFLILFILLFHALFGKGGQRLLDAGPIAVYSGGLSKGIISAARMTIFIAFSALLTFTTQPDRLAFGLGRLLAPFRKIGLPTDQLVLMLQLSLRFVPTILEEAHRLFKAQMSRGLQLDNKPLKDKARLVIALLVPVAASVFRRAVQLAESMEARGYRIGQPRSIYRSFRWDTADTLYLLSFALPIAAAAL